MRGYFGIGVEGISKQYNIGNIFRSAHAFGASFVFTVSANYERLTGANVDTSDSLGSLPFYSFPKIEDMILPKDCNIVGVEIDQQAIDLPSFRHPINATYIFGPERGNISKDMMSKCDHVIKIPSKLYILYVPSGLAIITSSTPNSDILCLDNPQGNIALSLFASIHATAITSIFFSPSEIALNIATSSPQIPEG